MADSLFRAVKHGDVLAARQLLRRRDSRDSDGIPDNLLSVAAWRGDTKMIQLLLEAGAKVDAAPVGDWTPVVAAAAANHVAAVRLLLAAGALVDVRPDGYPLLNWLEWAGYRTARQETIVRLLREAGAKSTSRWRLRWAWRLRYLWFRALRWLGFKSRIGPPPSGPPIPVSRREADESQDRGT